MHETLDIKHSSDFFHTAIHFCKNNNDISEIYRGSYDGNTNFMKLYNDMLVIL